MESLPNANCFYKLIRAIFCVHLWMFCQHFTTLLKLLNVWIIHIFLLSFLVGLSRDLCFFSVFIFCLFQCEVWGNLGSYKDGVSSTTSILCWDGPFHLDCPAWRRSEVSGREFFCSQGFQDHILSFPQVARFFFSWEFGDNLFKTFHC